MKVMERVAGYFELYPTVQKMIFIAFGMICLSPFVSTPLALVMGIFIAQFVGNPFEQTTKKLIHILLQVSVVGLGLGMNVHSALRAGKEGFAFTILGISLVISIGFILTRCFRIEKIAGYLISAGTAICGGSAIAAIAPIVKARPNQISVALAVVFALNSIALILFPMIGHCLHLSQHDFGLWCAIAIHDTSSVVGAANKYGPEALEVATTLKLARALWIIPFSIFSAFLFKNKESKIRIPWFIGFFLLAMVLNSCFPMVQKISPFMVHLAKAGLTLTLFLIGTGLSVQVMKNAGLKPMLLALSLWVFISCAALLMILR